MPASGPTTPTRRSVLACLAGAVAWPSAAPAALPLRHEQRRLFGSPIDVMLADDTSHGAGWMAATLGQLQRINDRWNAWKPGELQTLNAALRAGRSAPVSPALRAALRGAHAMEQASLGFFNAGIGGLVGAWGFHDDVMRDDARPSQRELDRWRDARPSLAQLRIRGAEVAASNPALQIDLGGYAKGVAIDAALGALAAHGCPAALVNLGGNLGAYGTPGALPWRIGIRDPSANGLLVTLATQGREAVVTSGSYERHHLADGERVTHLIDPFDAMPAPELVSATVVHPLAALADAGATALLVAGPRRWQAVAERMGLGEVLVVDRDGRCSATARLAARLQFNARLRRQDLLVV